MSKILWSKPSYLPAIKFMELNDNNLINSVSSNCSPDGVRKTFNISDINNSENLEVILKTINSDTLELNFEPDASFEYFVKKKINKSIEFINICILNNNDYISIIDNLRINTIDYSDIQNKIIDRMVNIKSKLKSIDDILVNYNTA